MNLLLDFDRGRRGQAALPDSERFRVVCKILRWDLSRLNAGFNSSVFDRIQLKGAHSQEGRLAPFNQLSDTLLDPVATAPGSDKTQFILRSSERPRIIVCNSACSRVCSSTAARRSFSSCSSRDSCVSAFAT